MSTPELKPCPFCGATAQPQDDDSFVSHDLGCFFTHQYAQETWLVGSRAKKRWNTRHNPAESALNAAREALKQLEAKWRDQSLNPLWTPLGREICEMVADEIAAKSSALAQIENSSPQTTEKPKHQ